MKNVKKIILMLVVLVSVFTGFSLVDVKAETAPNKLKMKPKSQLYYYSNGTNYISGYHFYRKQFTDGTYGYCVSNINTKVPGGMTLKLKNQITDMGLDYIIKNGWPEKSFTGNNKKDFYITQSAIWEYYDQTKGTHNWNTSFTAKSTGMKKYVYELVTAAKIAKNAEVKEPSITLVYGDTNMTLNADKSYFVSKEIGVTLSETTGVYTVTLVEAPEGTLLKNEKGEVKTEFNDGEKLFVHVPASSIKDGESGSVSLKVNATGLTYVTYRYTPGVKNYQDISPAKKYREETTLTTEKPLVLNFTKDKIVTKVKISKQDITSKKELPGAMLSIKDSTGKVVEQWVSGNEPHYIEGLPAGEYTLGEAIAPEGYVLSTETIKFSVKADGSVTNVVMYNAKETKVTKVKVSKQDIASKEELPGASLEIKDKNGKVVEKWVSGNEPHYIEGLAVGEYTLTETQAPSGYVLSTETVKFSVKADGSVTNVVMYNAKEVKVTKVKISKQDIASKEELPGASLEIKDSNGKVVEKWVSGNKAHYIEGLPAGKYTLTETQAPSGYVLSSETIEFEVKADGSVTSVVMYNVKDTKTTKVKVSKQDITNKKELPGATLVIKDKNGKIVDEWVSTDAPHYIEGLNPGDYTLTEKIAPKGYTLSEETITFTVKADGSLTSVVMMNAPQTEVPITDMNVSPMVIIIASILITLGTGMVVYYVKFGK